GRAQRGGLDFMSGGVVTRIRPALAGRVLGVLYRDWRGGVASDKTIDADYVVLACNAIEASRLWLMSKLENSRDLVGRNLMDHVQSDVVCYLPKQIYPFRGPQNTSSITSFLDHGYRDRVSSFNISIGNDGFGRKKGPFQAMDEMLWDASTKRI